MQAKQEIPLEWIRGSVRGHLIDLDTGERQDEFEIKNVTTYAGADVMARLLGGDTRYAPGYMGFIYGPTNAPTAALEQPPTSRIVTTASLDTELANAGVGGNVLVSPLSAGPGYAIDGSASNYSGNSVTLTAHSGTRLEYIYPVIAPYSDELTDLDYFWQALLLTRLVEGTTVTYLPFARVSLKVGGVFPQKPVNFELALYWDISIF
jgi:hypothetical protein